MNQMKILLDNDRLVRKASKNALLLSRKNLSDLKQDVIWNHVFRAFIFETRDLITPGVQKFERFQLLIVEFLSVLALIQLLKIIKQIFLHFFYLFVISFRKYWLFIFRQRVFSAQSKHFPRSSKFQFLQVDS